MSVSKAIEPHLPYLRRFARALSGSQRSGDAYVLATLESIVADNSAFTSAADPKVALYRTFLKIWNSLEVNAHGEPDDGSVAEQRLDRITPRPRQAFLLVSVEGFVPQEAAAVLEVDEAELTALIDEAGQEIAEQVATDILIIEDEPIIAMDLEGLVESLGHEVTAVARTRTEASEALQKRRPGMVLADIQLADGSSGVDAVNDILNDMELPVIFITAYPERLLTGERPEPAFLITKPFQADTVKAVISQALFFDQRSYRSDRPRLQEA